LATGTRRFEDAGEVNRDVRVGCRRKQIAGAKGVGFAAPAGR